MPDLYVVDGSLVVDTSVEAGPAEASALDAGDTGPDAVDGGGDDGGPEACVGVSCPACAPNPGQCCSNGIPCLGANCASACDAGCAACLPGEMCCSKQGGQPLCRSLDGGKCPP